MNYGDRLLPLPGQASPATRVLRAGARSSARVGREIDREIGSSPLRERETPTYRTVETTSPKTSRWSKAELAQRILLSGVEPTYPAPTSREFFEFQAEFTRLTGRYMRPGPMMTFASIGMRVHGPNSIAALRRLHQIHGEPNLLGWLRITPPFIEEGPPLPDDPEPRQPAESLHPFASGFDAGWLSPNEWSTQ